MNESFVLGHIMSRNSDPETVERAVAEYQSTPNLTNFCTLLFIPPANTVKIASAGGGAAGCTYRIANIGLQQTIPVYQKPGTYTLPMTLTAVVE